MNVLRKALGPALATLLLAACGSSGSSSSRTSQPVDYTAPLTRAIDDVIVPTYADLAARAADLRDATQALAAAPTSVNLTAARDAWVAARVPWEQSEGFLFGPVSNQGLDPSMDSWPVDQTQLDGVLASQLVLTPETLLNDLGNGLKGFHTIEYLLWGSNHAKSAAAFTARELEYLVAAAEALAIDTTTLHEAWAADAGYADKFLLAAGAGGLYFSQADAVQELVNGWIDICDEVANGKIADPFKAKDPMLVESQFSYNSTLDFADNIRSIENVYLGARGGVPAASGLSAHVASVNPALDAKIRAEITAAVAAITAISADGEAFRDAISNPGKAATIGAAQTAVGNLMTTLRGSLLPLVVG